MFRNQYDSDVTVWSPQGRLHQVEYAMEAVKLGSATVGLKNSDYAVLVALKRASSELSSYQKKIIPIDDHLGMSIAGITADARILSNYLRTICLDYKYSYDSYYPVARLILNLGNRMQSTTQRYDRRPYGVGLLIAGYDDKGPHIYQVLPSANYFDCKAMSIGSRSQTARTYLERHISTFPTCSKDDLICHGIQALRGSLPNDDLLSKDELSPLLNISIAIVGKGQEFKILDDDETRHYMAMAKSKAPKTVSGTSGGGSGGDDDDTPPPIPKEEGAGESSSAAEGPADPIPVVAMES